MDGRTSAVEVTPGKSRQTTPDHTHSQWLMLWITVWRGILLSMCRTFTCQFLVCVSWQATTGNRNIRCPVLLIFNVTIFDIYRASLSLFVCTVNWHVWLWGRCNKLQKADTKLKEKLEKRTGSDSKLRPAPSTRRRSVGTKPIPWLDRWTNLHHAI